MLPVPVCQSVSKPVKGSVAKNPKETTVNAGSKNLIKVWSMALKQRLIQH
tara:strand:- start:1365 stop:1514 length:150 start_codon:yes stop_codon:yes gene_type:complete